jgi:hypothetical protein
MAISIPAIIDTQLAALQAKMRPVQDAVTKADSFTVAPYALGNRVADLLDLLCGLVDSGTLTGVGIHGAADATNPVTSPDATNQATAETLLNEMKADYNAHRVLTAGSVHGAVDGANIVDAADADDLPKAITLVNQIKAKYEAHRIYTTSACHKGSGDEVNRITSPDAAVTLATVLTLANELKAKYNLHIAYIKAGSVSSVIDQGAFTGVNYLVGSTVTFTGNVTSALAGVTATVAANTVNLLRFLQPIPVAAAIGDTFTLAFSAIDNDLIAMKGGKALGDTAVNPYGSGPSMINALVKLISQLGGSVPAYLARTVDGVTHEVTYDPAEPFSFGNPHGGGVGHGGLMLIAAAMQTARDTVAAYTKPA